MNRTLRHVFVAIAALTLTAVGYAEEQPLKVGDTLPSFTLPYATADTIDMKGLSSDDMRGKWYMLAFYPADWSPGCTKEMCTFRDAITDFEDLGIEVLPVSADLVFSHHEWAKHHKLTFKLLADQTRAFGKEMGVYMPQYGMFKRSVFVVSPEGTIAYLDYDYSVRDDKDYHALKAWLSVHVK